MALYLLKFSLLMVCASATLFIGTLPLVHRAKKFLLEHDGPPLTRLQIRGVTIVFVGTGTALIATTALVGHPWLGTVKILGLLAWGIPMVLLDLRNYWLPLRYTSGFWLTEFVVKRININEVVVSGKNQTLVSLSFAG